MGREMANKNICKVGPKMLNLLSSTRVTVYIVHRSIQMEVFSAIQNSKLWLMVLLESIVNQIDYIDTY